MSGIHGSKPSIQFKSTIDVNLIQHCGEDAIIAAAAWVSTSAEEGLRRAISNPADVPGVINYLVKHRHGTPFEHNLMTFYIHAPIFVWREWHRHRIGFSYNEESGRYKKLEPVFYLPEQSRPMMKVDNWKPGRPKFLEADKYTVDVLKSGLARSYTEAYRVYEENLFLNVDPGLARDCLPVGIYSGCWVSCNARSMMSFLSLRTHEPEQAKFVSYPLWEIELAARQCETEFSRLFPITHTAFCENGRVAP